MSVSAGQRAASISSKLPKIWMKFAAGESGLVSRDLGTLTIVLRSDLVPKTAENFRGLCEGDYGDREDAKQPKYAGSRVFRIVPGLGIWAGDYERGDGLGGKCVVNVAGAESGKLNEEGMGLRHLGRGTVSMWPTFGTDTAASSFFIALARGPLPLLDGRAVVVGYVVAGFDALDSIESLGAPTGFPKEEVKLLACGYLPGDGSAQPGHLKAALRSETKGAASKAMHVSTAVGQPRPVSVAAETGETGAAHTQTDLGAKQPSGQASMQDASSRRAPAGIPVPLLRYAKPEVFRGPLASAVRADASTPASGGDVVQAAWQGPSPTDGHSATMGADTSFTGVATAMARGGGGRTHGHGEYIYQESRAAVSGSLSTASGSASSGPTVGQVVQARRDYRAQAMIQGGAGYSGASALHRVSADVLDDFNASKAVPN